jgi:hypothetical protein
MPSGISPWGKGSLITNGLWVGVAQNSSTCQKCRYLRLADAACGADACVTAIRLATGSVRQDETARAAMLVAAFGVSTWAFAPDHRFFAAAQPVTGGCDRPAQTQRCQARPQRLFVRWVPDLATYAGRLVGPNYIANNSLWYFRALQLKNVNQFLGMLKEYEIDAVLLTPSTPAAGLLDQFEGCSASAQTRPLWCIFPTRKLLANGRHDGALDE